jgi:copper(I)-binding protein
MTTAIRRRQALLAALACGLTAVAPATRACDFFSTRLRVYKPWARATDSRDRMAHVFMLFDEVTEGDRLIGVASPVAEGAEMVVAGVGQRIDLPIPAGVDTQLSEAGVFIRLTGLKHPLHLGREYPLTLIFKHGGTVEADLDIEFARDQKLG